MEMEDDQQQQQSPPRIHRIILEGIAHLADRDYRDRRHKLTAEGYNTSPAVDRRSLQHLVHFLGNDDSHEVTELVLHWVTLLQPSDGGLEILRSFFARSDMTLTKVRLDDCDFGTTEDVSRLLAAFERNRTVNDLSILCIGLQGAALGNCLSGVMQSMPQLQWLQCSGCALRVEGIRAFQPALQTNRTLRELNLRYCCIRDEGIRIVADALAGNIIMEVLDISHNDITSNGLDGITRLLESTRIKTINLSENEGVFNDEDATQRFAAVLSRRDFLKHLKLGDCRLRDEGIHLIVDGLVDNTTIEVLDISDNQVTSHGLDSITRLIESTQIKTIDLQENHHIFNDNVATQRFAAVLSRHDFLKHLKLGECRLRDEGIRIVADALVGNTTMEILDIYDNGITCVGLANITRLLVSTQIKTIHFGSNHGVFSDEDATQHFVTTLQHQKSRVQELPMIARWSFPEYSNTAAASYASIKNSLIRNQQLNHANLFLAPPPPQQQQPQRNAGTMMLKLSHKAITKFAMVPNNAGASAIFKLFQARPALLEKRIKRPASAAAAAAVSQEQQKRRRL